MTEYYIIPTKGHYSDWMVDVRREGFEVTPAVINYLDDYWDGTHYVVFDKRSRVSIMSFDDVDIEDGDGDFDASVEGCKKFFRYSYDDDATFELYTFNKLLLGTL
jgi:hypothetical protein